MRLQLLYICMLACPVAAMATDADSALVEHTRLARMISADAERNPAIHGAAYSASFSQLALGVDYQHQSEAFVQQLGSGYVLPYAGVDTYLRLSQSAAVWGSASYTAGIQKDVKWNSTSDYALLQPYVLADTLGGDTHRERYAFAGGYATRLDKWMLGAEMQFRAEQEYRDRDPRMRGIVTDLTLRLGAGRQMGRYTVGAAFEGNVYRQTNSVTFYSEEGVIPEYQMTGLGTEYSRFSGDKRSLYYDGGGVALLLNAAPTDSRGLYADLTLGRYQYHRKLAEYNSMPLTDLYREQAALTIGWRTPVIAVFASANYTKRTGDEWIGGTSDARYFPTIGRLTMYKHQLINASLGALYCRNNLSLMLRSGYKSSNEKYVYPERKMDYSQIYGQLKAQYFHHASDRLMLSYSADALYQANLTHSIYMPFANMTSSFVQMINHTYDYAKANYTNINASVRADYHWDGSRYGAFTKFGGGVVLCSTGEHQTALHASIGITF